MKWEKQYRLRDELNASYPRIRSNIGQQMFRSAYYNLRLAGQSVTHAARTARPPRSSGSSSRTSLRSRRRQRKPPYRGWKTLRAVGGFRSARGPLPTLAHAMSGAGDDTVAQSGRCCLGGTWLRPSLGL